MTPRELHAEALARVAARDWEEAARTFVSLAGAFEAQGEVDDARQAWEAAGECWRRADRPVAAAQALRTVLADPQASGGPLARIKLAGVYVDLGEMAMAEAACRRVLSLEDDPGLQAFAADTAIGVLEAMGHKEEARALLSLLGGGDPRRDAARGFREAQLARLDGRLPEALAGLERVIEALGGIDGAESGIAAARGEGAEVALLQGRFVEALAGFAASASEHEAAGRQSLRWRAEAGRTRAAVEAGTAAFGPALDEGIRWARERGMAPLVIDLRIARGMARAERDPAGAGADLDDAVREADGLGLPLKAGRARLERATRVPGPEASREALLDRAIADLADYVPLLARAQAAREAPPGA